MRNDKDQNQEPERESGMYRIPTSLIPTWRDVRQIGFTTVIVGLLAVGLTYQRVVTDAARQDRHAADMREDLKAVTSVLQNLVRVVDRASNIDAQLLMAIDQLSWVVAQFCINGATTPEEERRCTSLLESQRIGR